MIRMLTFSKIYCPNFATTTPCYNANLYSEYRIHIECN